MAFISLLESNPKLAKEWDYDKNGNHRPENTSPRSNKTVFWLCDKGHSYPARVSHRQNGSGCPYCSGRLAIPGETDLATTHPKIAAEWDYSLNTDVLPSTVKAGSSAVFYWKCIKDWLMAQITAIMEKSLKAALD